MKMNVLHTVISWIDRNCYAIMSFLVFLWMMGIVFFMIGGSFATADLATT